MQDCFVLGKKLPKDIKADNQSSRHSTKKQQKTKQNFEKQNNGNMIKYLCVVLVDTLETRNLNMYRYVCMFVRVHLYLFKCPSNVCCYV